MGEKRYTEKEAHQKIAVDLFNRVWELIDKGDNRTKEENDEMIHAAHASRYHWGVVVAAKTPETGPINIERGEWQISRVYAVLKMTQPALYHARRCLEICKENTIGDLDRAFAYEAMARASAVAGNKSACEKYRQLAQEAGMQIKKKGDREYFFSELETVTS
jgi:hypothetical protein